MAPRKSRAFGSSAAVHRGAARLELGTLRRFEKMINDPRETCTGKLAAYGAWNDSMGAARAEVFSMGRKDLVKRLMSYRAKRNNKLRNKVILRCER